MPNHGNAFQQMCNIEVDKSSTGGRNDEDQSWFLRLVPVSDNDVDWMSSQNTSIAEFTFQSMAEDANNEFAWFLGGTPSPSLDALEGALAFLSSQCSYNASDPVQVELLSGKPKDCLGIITQSYNFYSAKAFENFKTLTPENLNTLITRLKEQVQVCKQQINSNESLHVYECLATGFFGILYWATFHFDDKLTYAERSENFLMLSKLLKHLVNQTTITTGSQSEPHLVEIVKAFEEIKHHGDGDPTINITEYTTEEVLKQCENELWLVTHFRRLPPDDFLFVASSIPTFSGSPTSSVSGDDNPPALELANPDVDLNSLRQASVSSNSGDVSGSDVTSSTQQSRPGTPMPRQSSGNDNDDSSSTSTVVDQNDR